MKENINVKELFEENVGTEFMDFLESDNDGKIVELINGEGIDYLISSKYIKKKMLEIFDYSKYIDKLLENEKFFNLFMSIYSGYFCSYLSKLNYNNCDKILDYAIKNEMNVFDFLLYFNYDYLYYKINNWPYNYKILIGLLQTSIPNKCKNLIISKYPIKLVDLDIYKFFIHCKKSNIPTIAYIDETLYISPRLFTRDFLERLVNNYDIFKIREIINCAAYVTDPEIIEKYVEQYEINKIHDYKNYTLSSPYKEIMEKLEQLSENNKDTTRTLLELKSMASKLEDSELSYLINKLPSDNTIFLLKRKISDLNDNQLSNIIIDYHFKENFHNVLIDIKELLKSYFAGNIILPKDKVILYKRILSIDSLSSSEKIQLFEDLKAYNMVEMFYDDMAYARKIIREAVKDNLLKKEELKNYLDLKLSRKYGVPVYKFDGEPFFALVKSGRKENMEYPIGYSYSVVGNGCIAIYSGNIFGNEKNNTYVYDSSILNPEQIVHIFPFDSFTRYNPFKNNEIATNRINVLRNLHDLLAISGNRYNEFLIMEAGTNLTDMAERIPELKRIALFCLDEIKENDITNAKNNNLGILLVSSKKYKKPIRKLSSIYADKSVEKHQTYYVDEAYRNFENTRKNGGYKL